VLLYVVFACLTAIVLLVLLRPLAGTRGSDGARDAFNAAVYRDQLTEVESDRERGLIAETEAEAARIEIGRRLLATDPPKAKSDPARDAGKDRKQHRLSARAVMIGVAALLPALALGLYLVYGSPRLPDQPLAARLQDPASDQNLAALVARVEARLREHPEDGEGWEVIAPVYMAWRRYTDAADAYAQAGRLLGESPKRLSGYGQALVLANDGVVSEDARRALARAAELDPDLIEPRILIAIAKEQDGQFAAAIEAWRALLAKGSSGDAPWRDMVRQRIAADEGHLAGKSAPGAPLAGKPVAGEAAAGEPSGGASVGGQGGGAVASKPEGASPEAGPKGGGPTAGDMAAAQNLSPVERQAMIEQMVQRLAARLDQQGNDLGGWLKLVRAYSVLDRKDDAMKALAKARVQFSGDATALGQLDALATELGLKS
jgi:cytochrome c-type biogenesis protein CcmH